jgi:predicted MFS family arabinose efflux permease
MIPYFPYVQASLHMSDSALGFSLLFSPLGAVLATPLMGRLIPRYGCRALILITGVGACIATPMALLAPQLWLFRIACFIFGALNSSQDVVMNTEAVVIQQRYPRPIISSTHGCWSVGGFLAGGGVSLAAKLGQLPVLHTALVNICIILMLLVAVGRLLPHQRDEVIDSPSFVIPKGVLLTLGLLAMCAFAAEGAAFDWLAVFFRTVLRTSESAAAAGFACFGVAAAVGRFLGDAVVHRIGNRHTLLYGGLLSAFSLVIAVSLRSPAACYPAFVLCGLGISNLIPILFRAGGSVPGQLPSIGVAAVGSCGYAAFLVSPPLIGLIADHASLPIALGGVGLLVLFVAGLGPRALRHTTLT